MVTLPTLPELRAIEEAHRAAQARLGIAGAYLALQAWTEVSPTTPEVNADAWLTRSLSMIRAIQLKSSRLAKAYYQLARAVEVGRTLGVPEYSDDPKAITMGGLRKQYLNLLVEIAQIDDPEVDNSNSTDERDEDEEAFERALREADTTDLQSNNKAQRLADVDLDSYIQDWAEKADYDTDDEPVPVDTFKWRERGLTKERLREIFAEELSEAARVQAEKVARLERDDNLKPSQFTAKARAAHEASGNIGAGKVDEFGIRAGREVIGEGISRDRLVQQIARGTSGNPCAFCAMLASRGWVNRSNAGPGFDTDGGNDIVRVHENCHCFPLVRWVMRPDSDLPELSAYYKKMWPIVTKGKSYQTLPDGKVKNNALNAWRRWMNAERRKDREALASQSA